MSLISIPSDRAEWLGLRRNYIGGSEIASLFGAQPEYCPGIYALWCIKAGLVEPEDAGNERARWGLMLEDAIAAAAADREGWTIKPGMFAVHDGVRGLSATLDKIIPEPGEQERAKGWTGPGALEVKNVDWLVHRKSWEVEPPVHILLQLQHQLAASGFRWGAVATLIGGNRLEVYRYEARPKLIRSIERRVAGFWDSIDADQRPDPDASDATTQTLLALASDAPEDDPGADLLEDDEAAADAALYLSKSAEIKIAEKVRAAAKNRLLARCLNHRWARMNGYRLNIAVTPEKPAHVITEADVGTILSGRAAAHRITVREISQ